MANIESRQWQRTCKSYKRHMMGMMSEDSAYDNSIVVCRDVVRAYACSMHTIGALGGSYST